MKNFLYLVLLKKKLIDANVTKNDFEDLLKYIFPEITFETKYLALALKKQVCTEIFCQNYTNYNKQAS